MRGLAFHGAVNPRWGSNSLRRGRGLALLSSLPGRYGMALLCTLIALLLQYGLWSFLHIAPFLFFILAVMVSGWWGGWGPAMASTALSALTAWLWLLPSVRLHGPRLGNVLALSLFVLVSMLITWLNVSRRRFSAERVVLLEREKAARREAEAERARLRTIFQDAPALIALLRGPEHVIVLSNTLSTEFSAGQEVTGKPLRQVRPEAEVQGFLELLDQVYATGKPFFAREALVRRAQPDGSTREAYLNFICQPTRDAQGQVEGVAAFAFDVTELVHARRRAEEAERSLLSLAESIPAIVWSAGADGINDYYNRRWYEYTGIPQGSLDFELTTAACHPEDLAANAARWQECRERGVPFSGEYRLLRAADQAWRWHLVRTIPWKDESGRVARWYGTSFDIDEQKRAEAALRESEARFRNMADHAPVMLWMTDAAGRCTYFSRPWYTFTGRTEAESLGQQWLAAVHPEDVGGLREVASAAFSRREPYWVEYRLRRADAEYRWVHGSAVPRLSASGEFLGYIGSIIDMTDRKRSEELLALLARAGAMVGTSLDETETLSATAELAVPAFSDWCLVDLQQADGAFQRVRAVHAARGDAELARQSLRFGPTLDSSSDPAAQALLRGESLIIEHLTPEQVRASAQSEEHARLILQAGLSSCIMVPLVARGSTLGVLSFFTSRSGRHYMEADRAFAEALARRAALAVDNARLYKSAQEAVRLRDEFLSVASHELKTPLTPLSLKLQVLAREAAMQPDSPFVRKVRTHVEAGRGQVAKLGALIGDLLDVSRISAGRMRLSPEPVDFAALVREVVQRHEPQAAREGTSLQVEAPPALVGTWDALRLEQVVVNLVDNALKYGAGRPVHVRLAEEAGQAVLTVRDQGIGIAPEAQRRIFERFARAVSERHYGGLGLGLYITRTLVEAMGGSIEVQSEVGKGATFTVVLPRSVPKAAAGGTSLGEPRVWG
jgi:PAS domain S-box-containing protein